MNEIVIGISLVLNIIVIGVLLNLKKDKPKIEVHYFEYIEEIEGVIRDSKKVSVCGQILIDGAPIGGQYVVAEKVFEKVDYEKIKSFRNEVVEPFAKAGIQAAQLLSGIPDIGDSKRSVIKAAKFFKSKII